MRTAPNSLNRREFLLSSATVVMAATAFPTWLGAATASSTAQVGSQLYGWGQYYEREGRKFDLNEILSALRDAGYSYAEGSLDISKPENNVTFADQLRAKGMAPVCLYTGGRLHETPDKIVEAITSAAKVAAKAGFSVLNCNPDPIGRLKTDAELDTQAKALQQLGTELTKFGMKLGLHHHTPEMANGAQEFHSNFKKTSPREVGFCYDVHWVFRGGVEPKEALAAYGDRIVSWHLRQSREKIWWEDLDTGDLDYTAIARTGKEKMIPQIYSVELALEQGTKITRTVVANHARSREFVRKVFGV